MEFELFLHMEHSPISHLICAEPMTHSSPAVLLSVQDVQAALEAGWSEPGNLQDLPPPSRRWAELLNHQPLSQSSRSHWRFISQRAELLFSFLFPVLQHVFRMWGQKFPLCAQVSGRGECGERDNSLGVRVQRSEVFVMFQDVCPRQLVAPNQRAAAGHPTRHQSWEREYWYYTDIVPTDTVATNTVLTDTVPTDAVWIL